MVWAEMWDTYIEYYVIVIYIALDLLGFIVCIVFTCLGIFIQW